MRQQHVAGTLWIVAVLCAGLTVVATPAREATRGEGSGDQLLTVTIESRFETEEVNIPGWEAGMFSEPVGEGTVELRLVFPASGGEPTVQSGRAELDLYGCRGSAPCTCSIPVQVIDRLWEPVIFDRLSWDVDAGVLRLMGPVEYPDDQTSVTIRCTGSPETVVPDYPLFKLLGAFSEANDRRWESMFAVPLSTEGRGHEVFERELYSRGPKVFRARIEITVQPGRPPSER